MKQRKTTYTVKKELSNDAWNRELYKNRPLDPKNFTDKDYITTELNRYDSESNINNERSAGSRIHSIGAYSIAGVCGFIFALLMAICVYRVVVLDAEPLSIMDFLNYAETIDIIPFTTGWYIFGIFSFLPHPQTRINTAFLRLLASPAVADKEHAYTHVFSS